MQCSIGMQNIYGKLYTGDPNAPSSWPVATFYTSNKHQVANCKKNSPGCHYLQIIQSYKPRTIVIRVKVGNETLYSEIDFDMKHKAFTLIELLVVVAIIGTLSAVGVVAYNGYTNSAKEKNYRAEL